VILLFVIVPVLCGIIASNIAKKKNRSYGGFFVLGLFLGVIGIVIAALVAPGTPRPPPGTRAVTCARCNAVQNVRVDAPEFECWQCNTICTVRP